jgi:hypothetical protein
MLNAMVLEIPSGIEMKREHGAAYSSETNTVAAPATVSGWSAAFCHWIIPGRRCLT